MKEKVIESLTGVASSASLVKHKSIMPRGENFFEIRYGPEDRHFFPTQKSAHKQFGVIDRYKSGRSVQP